MRISLHALACLAATVAMSGAGAVAITAAPAGAATTTTVVTAGSLAPHGVWSLEPSSDTGSFSFVSGPAIPPSGTGSLAMSIASGDHEWLNNYAYGACATGPNCTVPVASWTSLANVDALGFSTYRSSGSTYPTLNVEVDPGGTGSDYDTFVFIPNGGAVTNGIWQTWNALSPASGAWSSSHTLSSGPFTCAPQSCTASFSQIVAAYPNAKIKYGLGPNLGTGGTFAGNIDDLTVGVSGNTTVYNFEPAPSAPHPVSGVPGNRSVKVSWKPPASDGGSAITGYTVVPYLAGVAQPAHVYNSTATTETVAGLQNGKSYRFQIAAQNAVGTGAWSATSGGTIAGAPGQPSKPSVRVAGSGIRVSFHTPANNGAAIKSFSATCTSGNGGATGTHSGSASPVTVTGLTHGKTYTCQVSATNSRGAGPRSVASAAVSP